MSFDGFILFFAFLSFNFIFYGTHFKYKPGLLNIIFHHATGWNNLYFFIAIWIFIIFYVGVYREAVYYSKNARVE